MIDPRTAASILGGDVVARDRILIPGPGHSRKDRSLAVKFTCDDILVHSFAGQDWAECKTYVRAALRLEWRPTSQKTEYRPVYAPRHEAEVERNREWESALINRIWEDECEDPQGTIVEQYLCETRGLYLPKTEAIKFHPDLKVLKTDRSAPAMVSALTDIRTGELKGLQRSWLTPDAKRIDRAMLGQSKGCVIRIDPDDAVTLGLGIGEGLETCIAARTRFRPFWCALSNGGIRDFPILSGVEHLEIFADNDANGTGWEAALACRDRWQLASWEVGIRMPDEVGTDFADVLRAGP